MFNKWWQTDQKVKRFVCGRDAYAAISRQHCGGRRTVDIIELHGPKVLTMRLQCETLRMSMPNNDWSMKFSGFFMELGMCVTWCLQDTRDYVVIISVVKQYAFWSKHFYIRYFGQFDSTSLYCNIKSYNLFSLHFHAADTMSYATIQRWIKYTASKSQL